jgi:hypothetical protein
MDFCAQKSSGGFLDLNFYPKKAIFVIYLIFLDEKRS